MERLVHDDSICTGKKRRAHEPGEHVDSGTLAIGVHVERRRRCSLHNCKGVGMHPRDTYIMQREGCQCCEFDREIVVTHPVTDEVIDRFSTNVYIKGATLRIQAGLLAREVDNAETIGDRDERLERFFTARHRYFDHVRYGS